MILKSCPFGPGIVKLCGKSGGFSVYVNTDPGRRGKRIALHVINGKQIAGKTVNALRGFVCRIAFMVNALQKRPQILCCFHILCSFL